MGCRQGVKSGINGCAVGMHVTAERHREVAELHTIRRVQTATLMWVGTLATGLGMGRGC